MTDDFLTPIDVDTIANIDSLDAAQWGRLISIYDGEFPDMSEVKVALFGVCEARGNKKNAGAENAPDSIRKYLYELYQGNYEIKIADIGNIQAGNTLRDTYVAVSKVVNDLLSMNIVPVIIGGTHDLTYAQFSAYQDLNRNINLAIVDNKLDIKEGDLTADAENFLYKILMHQPNFILHFSQLAYQTHFTSRHAIETMEQLQFDSYRLGRLREDITEAEPALRNVHLLSFDVSAIRAADAPGNGAATPNGLTGQEACQLARYAGMSEQVSSLGIYEVNPLLDYREITAALAAQMIWYFVDGFYQRQSDLPQEGDARFVKYIVHFKDTESEIAFWKSQKTERWWMEVPAQAEGKLLRKKPQLVPCSYNDYQVACREELPERWIRAYQRLN
jgi:formiminoglutamase